MLTKILKRILNSIKWRLNSIKTRFYIETRFYVKTRLRIKHVYGPKNIKYGKKDVVVISVFKNAELHVKSFIEHYFSLGAKHIVLLDNDSTDQTISIAMKYNKITILKTDIPFRQFECELRRYLINRFCKNRWCIVADIDELFDYPFSDVISIASLLEYLNANSYNAVVSQMLDMLPDKSLDELKHTRDVSSKDCQYYDISNIRSINYRDFWLHDVRFTEGTIVPNENIKWNKGGIRKTIFGTDNWLTKPTLICSDGNAARLIQPHGLSNALYADFSTVVYHYLFLGDFYEKCLRYSSEQPFYYQYEYETYLLKSIQNPDIAFRQKTAQKINNVNDLLKDNFLVVSEKYIQWVKQNAKPKKLFPFDSDK